MSLPAATSELIARLAGSGIRLGTEATRRLLSELGIPGGGIPVVLVAGTNGKGSTAALLAAISSAAGYRTGLFTSPPLEAFEEQVRVDGQIVAGPVLGQRLSAVMAAAARALDQPPTLFEATTAAALLHFAVEGCALAVLEAGMGGKRDATNATEPVLSVLTSVAADHLEAIGPTLADVAAEKAGILRAGRPAVMAELASADLDETVRREARRIGAELISVAAQVQGVEIERRAWSGQRVTFTTPQGRHDVDLHLLGDHQAHNLLLAVVAAETLCRLGWERCDRAAIAGGAAAVRWPGRLELVELPSGRRVLLDAAHNPAGIATLARFLDQLGEPFSLVFGVLAEKAVTGMLPPLARRACRVVLTRPGGPRARPPHELAALVPRGIACAVEPDLGSALGLLLAEKGCPLVVVCGSVLLAGEARGRLRARHGVPPPAAVIASS
jgi:dihydrofolate synthase / folylpolyglutamate synthase